MIEFKNIDKKFETEYSRTEVYNDLNLHIDKQEFVVVIGANGSGKSTLLNILTNEVEIDSGSIWVDNHKISSLKKHKIYQRISRVHQNPSQGTSPNLTIMENFILTQNKGRLLNLRFLKNQQTSEFKKQIERLEMGLEHKLDVKVSHLSGGQRQALSLLMASLSKPDILLLDEHTAALDPKSSNIIMNITKRLVEDGNMTTIMVTHNLQYALDYGDRLIMFKDGKLALDIKGDDKAQLTINELRKFFTEFD